jgi:hypothetical protein
MRSLFVLYAASFVLVTSNAHAAAGVNLRWQQCLGDGGTINRSFACDTNSGTHVLVSSFELAQPIPQVFGNEIILDLASAGPALPSWWAFKNVGTCRQTSMSMSAVGSPTAIACVDWASGKAAGGVGAYHMFPFGPTTARFMLATAVPAAALPDLVAGQEYFSNSIAILNTKTVGDGACAGCTTPVCLVLNRILVVAQIAANDRALSGPTNGTDSDYATWQGGSNVVSYRGSGCPAATPTRRGTWGEVKSLYR